MISYLLDENLTPAIRTQLARIAPDIRVWVVGDPGTVPRGTPDPDILEWCEEHDVILVTSNRHSMPGHLSDHLARGRHVPGIIFLSSRLDFGDILNGLVLIWGASLPSEFQDTASYLHTIIGMDEQ